LIPSTAFVCHIYRSEMTSARDCRKCTYLLIHVMSLLSFSNFNET